MINPVKIILCAALVAASGTLLSAANITPVIPAPLKAEARDGQFQLTDTSRIISDASFKNEAQLLAARLRLATGFALKMKSPGTAITGGDIVLTTGEVSGPEGYALSVTPSNIVISSATSAGIFYGTQSLLQLLPPEVFSKSCVTNIGWEIRCVEIQDSPSFVWRGFMLDVSRHFFTVPEVEQVLDLMALYKLNTFHWHLVDDQGWRIQIKHYPKLTSVGAWRKAIGFGLDPKSTTAYNSEGKYGGYYTQRDIRAVVAYAAARHITIVPEIEMPGHSVAALAAYPQFSCTGGPFDTDHDGGVYDGVYDVSNEAMYIFLGNVLREVAGLFPGKYIHIGGDEVPKEAWFNSPGCQALMKSAGLKNERELQSYFTRRIEKIVNDDGKSIIGWSEIREGGLTPSAALMDWIGGGAESAASGHDVVMTPTTYCYFDHYQSTNQTSEPKAIGGFLPLKQVYEFDPMPEKLAPENKTRILGGQANLWTEYVPNLRQVEYMMLPRIGALAEADWSPKEARNWEDFKARTVLNEKRLYAMGVNFRPLSKAE